MKNKKLHLICVTLVFTFTLLFTACSNKKIEREAETSAPAKTGAATGKELSRKELISTARAFMDALMKTDIENGVRENFLPVLSYLNGAYFTLGWINEVVLIRSFEIPDDTEITKSSYYANPKRIEYTLKYKIDELGEINPNTGEIIKKGIGKTYNEWNILQFIEEGGKPVLADGSPHPYTMYVLEKDLPTFVKNYNNSRCKGKTVKECYPAP